MGKFFEIIIYGMKIRCLMENFGNLKGWIKGGIVRKEKKSNREKMIRNCVNILYCFFF